MSKILITGASGLVGKPLSWSLVKAGHQVVHLSRKVRPTAVFKTYEWDVHKSYIDEKAFEGVDHIIHLAGAGVADKRWTKRRKQEIMDSRVKSTELLYDYAKKLDIQLQSYVSASAIGVYEGAGEQWIDEEGAQSNGFLAEVVKRWEGAADLFATRTKVAKVRIGVVLSDNGGALTEIAKPVRLFAGAPLGSGDQYMSWIHVNDLVGIFKHIVQEKLEGVFNAVAPNPVTNRYLTATIAEKLDKPLFLPNVPPFAMKLILGEMASMVLNGAKVSPEKILKTGYQFDYIDPGKAVEDLLV